MACACKVNQEIDRITKYYSYNKNTREKRNNASVNKKDVAITALIYIMLLPLLPVIFIAVFIYALFSSEKKISFGKFLRFLHNTRNGRQQQVI